MKSFVIENRSLTSSPVFNQDFWGDEYSSGDLLVRVRSENQFKTISLTSTNTQIIRDGLNEYFNRHSQDIELLRTVIFWQKKTIDYQALHTAFLLGSLSEEQFDQESDKFSVRHKDIQPELIASVIERLDTLIGIHFDTSDYADYFQSSQETVMAGLRLLPQQHFVELLPEQAREQ